MFIVWISSFIFGLVMWFRTNSELFCPGLETIATHVLVVVLFLLTGNIFLHRHPWYILFNAIHHSFLVSVSTIMIVFIFGIIFTVSSPAYWHHLGSNIWFQYSIRLSLLVTALNSTSRPIMETCSQLSLSLLTYGSAGSYPKPPSSFLCVINRSCLPAGFYDLIGPTTIASAA